MKLILLLLYYLLMLCSVTFFNLIEIPINAAHSPEECQIQDE